MGKQHHGYQSLLTSNKLAVIFGQMAPQVVKKNRLHKSCFIIFFLSDGLSVLIDKGKVGDGVVFTNIVLCCPPVLDLHQMDCR
jgi:hypothetical protein